MDCEKFDQHVIDELYGELDEETSAAVRRHAEECARCADVLSGLRQTREAAVLPLEEPSDDLEDRILNAAVVAQEGIPWHRTFWRGVAWAGSHAMRPQLAMAAIFMLVVGSSLLLLRAKPGAGVAPVEVSERGTPATMPADQAYDEEGSLGRARQAKGADAPAAAEPAMDDAVATAEGKASKDEEDADAQGDAALALSEARRARDAEGCQSAVAKFDEVGTAHTGTRESYAAMWEAAKCYESMGELDKARALYLALRANAQYRDRADAAIAANEGSQTQNLAAAPGAGSPAAAAPRAPAKQKAAAEAPAPYDAEDTSGGSSNTGVAGPQRNSDLGL
jgi:hypothetical protein